MKAAILKYTAGALEKLAVGRARQPDAACPYFQPPPQNFQASKAPQARRKRAISIVTSWRYDNRKKYFE
jgi:hypothetical protein